jgi:long-chain acyl-CoA synthetase
VPGCLLSGERKLEQAALLGGTARAAAALRSLGIGSEDTVALVLRNDFAFFEASLAARMLGASPVPVNWHFTAEEAGYVLRDCRARAVVIHADLLARLGEALPADVPRFVVPTPPEIAEAYGISPAQCGVPDGEQAWQEWITGFEPHPPREIPPPSSMMYTSGTTGHPKGVRRFAPSPEQEAIGRSLVGSVLGMSGEI